jgi:hypothetical protein
MAALAILAKIRVGGYDLEARHGTQPQFRIGLNTGPAIVDQVQGGPDGGVTVMGDRQRRVASSSLGGTRFRCHE